MASLAGFINVPPGPSWFIINADNPISIPLIGQFDPKIQRQRGKPLWQKKPGIAGGIPWLKYIGEDIGFLTFEFLMIATTINDLWPEVAWARLNELARNNETLGRPPRVYFNHGLTLVEGFITNIPDAPFEHWGESSSPFNSRVKRQIGPIRVTITELPKEKSLISFGTNFVTRTEETKFEDVSRLQYGDPRFSQTLAIHNQGVKLNTTLELPRKESNVLSRVTPIAPYFDDPIEGL